MACVIVTVPHNKNTIHDSMIWEKKIFFLGLMMWHIILGHINLGLHISMS
jgi:hypothetical protein